MVLGQAEALPCTWWAHGRSVERLTYARVCQLEEPALQGLRSAELSEMADLVDVMHTLTCLFCAARSARCVGARVPGCAGCVHAHLK